MPLPLAPDGCILPNIPTRLYQIFYIADCEHGKYRAATVEIRATDIDAARAFAERWIKFPQMHIDLVSMVL